MENVFEELDSPGEFFYDARAHKLYLYHNGTGAPPSDGIEVHGWFMPAKEGAASAPTLLFAHENAGNIGLRLPEYKLLHEHVGVNILAYDYRGYGYSDEAEINEAGLMRDARAASSA